MNHKISNIYKDNILRGKISCVLSVFQVTALPDCIICILSDDSMPVSIQWSISVSLAFVSTQ